MGLSKAMTDCQLWFDSPLVREQDSRPYTCRNGLGQKKMSLSETVVKIHLGCKKYVLPAREPIVCSFVADLKRAACKKTLQIP